MRAAPGLGGEGGEAKPKPKKERKPRPEPEELTLTGKLEKKETTKTKEGKERTYVKYYLTDADGNKIRIPKPRPARKKKGEEAAPAPINLDDHLDRNVTIVAMGTKSVRKKGEKETTKYRISALKSITAAGGEKAAEGEAVPGEGDEG